MPRELVVILGDLAGGHTALPVAAEFGWALETVASLDGLSGVSSQADVVAVLVDPSVLNLPWEGAISAVQQVAPESLPILCHRFSTAIDWPSASAGGAFHVLGLPLSAGELRQSLGFVWAEKSKRPQIIPLDTEERSRRAKRADSRKRAARGHVA